MPTYHVQLTMEAHKSCLAKPTTKLLHTILALKPGDKLVITADETLIPLDRILTTLQETGLRIENIEHDLNMTKIIAVKE